ncbi:hypothetical protein [Burkholderia sp. Ac-20379]|uniref:hypothetical protein n=1 Tax=Burkholderia sp. Ac-20379 TaxID=2703900 RepID=UPI0019824D94|nr:hypothetical protein [Burkholderia sp. Ac-20379]MBN3726706.1 hypothetical protein [Burkholderia sp. Ac-20379]
MAATPASAYATAPVIPSAPRTLTTFDTTEHVDAQGCPFWVLRTAHFGLVMTRIEGHALFDVRHVEEAMVVAPASLRVTIAAGGERLDSRGDTLFILPPGAGTIEAQGSGHLARIVGAQDLAAFDHAINAGDYIRAASGVRAFEAWPAPRDGYRLRRYALDAYADPTLPGRAFRCTNLMVNITDVYPGKRDSRKLKPHSHDDFEQITLTYAGRFAHHLRTPWGADSTRWQPDEHLEVGSPAALALPAGLVHTSQALEAGCWLVDIFGPPRLDFSLMPGFVRNDGEYPLPE